jgi:hypothetical protein
MATLALAGRPADSAEAVAFVEAYVGPLLDYLPVGLVIADGDGSIVRVNSHADRLLGMRLDAGRPIRSVLPFVARPSEAEAWVGMVPGRPEGPVRVRCARIACQPGGALIYCLEEVPPPCRLAPAAPRPSRFAPSRWARL